MQKNQKTQNNNLKNLKHLGKNTNYTFEYNPNLLESVPNPHVENDYFIKLILLKD